MARIAGVDLPRKKRIEFGLTYIYGIGLTSSRRILGQAGIDFAVSTDDLTEDQDSFAAAGLRLNIPLDKSSPELYFYTGHTKGCEKMAL